MSRSRCSSTARGARAAELVDPGGDLQQAPFEIAAQGLPLAGAHLQQCGEGLLERPVGGPLHRGGIDAPLLQPEHAGLGRHVGERHPVGGQADGGGQLLEGPGVLAGQGHVDHRGLGRGAAGGAPQDEVHRAAGQRAP